MSIAILLHEHLAPSTSAFERLAELNWMSIAIKENEMTLRTTALADAAHETDLGLLVDDSPSCVHSDPESPVCSADQVVEQELRAVAVRDAYIETSECAQDQPVRPTTSKIRWDYAIFFVTLHLLALLALHPYFFSWAGVVSFVVGTIVFGQMAIPIGYHRLLSHRSFRTPKWFERTLVTLAMCSAQETPAHWVAWHRMHHSHSDHRDDPHSPRLGVFWAHISWLMYESRTRLATFSMYEKYARDILADPYYRWIEKLPIPAGIFFLGHAVLFAVIANLACVLAMGNTSNAYQLAASLFIWGVILRTVWVWHITWSVNSITHVFGYRNYETSDDSRNNWFVTLLTAGEGWHNNHHADPASASVQHRWWEIDLNYYVIRLFGALGLATHIIRPRCQRKPIPKAKPA